MTIRNVPDETRDKLAQRAESAGQSLQEYVKATLIGLAERETIDEVLARTAARREQAGERDLTDDIVRIIREARGV